jgi:hypothetical protein
VKKLKKAVNFNVILLLLAAKGIALIVVKIKCQVNAKQ